MGQSYSFHEGDVRFTSKFYDTNMVQIWLDYEENMNQSSIWWGTIYAERNRSAMDLEGGNMYADGRPSVVSAVSWWQLGDDVLAMSEGRVLHHHWSSSDEARLSLVQTRPDGSHWSGASDCCVRQQSYAI